MPNDSIVQRAPHLYPDADAQPRRPPEAIGPVRAHKRWIPRRVFITKSAHAWPLATEIAARAAALGADIVELGSDRLEGLRGPDARATYLRAKTTLAVVVSPPSQRKLQPIPPSADWQFHLARGCPAHCQYCYLAGSLAGPPVTRVYANLPEILAGLGDYLDRGTITSRAPERAAEGTTFEASCYTDPLALEHLTGGLTQTIAYFGAWDAHVQLRFTTKFDAVDGLLSLAHAGRTRARFSLNAREITRRFEGGTASLDDRICALRRMARAGYPVGLTIAPIMPIPGWRAAYDELFAAVESAVAGIAGVDLTVELITHRFTPGSKDVLLQWYPATRLEMDETQRSNKRTKFGGSKFVYRAPVMRELRGFFEARIAARLGAARILYWT